MRVFIYLGSYSLLNQSSASLSNALKSTLFKKQSGSFMLQKYFHLERKEAIQLLNKFCPRWKVEHRTEKFFSSESQNKTNETENNADSKTHFGNKTVTTEEKAKKVHGVFETVAANYDLMNDVMSGGIHRLWKDIFVAHLGPTVGIKLLDVAGGTGDITFRVMQHIQNQMKEQNYPVHDVTDKPKFTDFEEDIYSAGEQTLKKKQNQPESKVTVCDISKNMLAVGQARATSLGYDNIDWVCGDAEDLPFPDSSFDAYTIAYGMRNVVNVNRALREAYRVLKPGGRFLCLEFSHVKNPLIRRVYDLYSFQLIPVMGQVIAADWDSYQYLVESIRKFPDQETYKAMIEDAGFRKVSYEDLTFGITSIHTGFKI